MAYQPIYALPGICKANSDYASGSQQGQGQGRIAYGRYRDGDKVRFAEGFPEKIGGWTQALSSVLTGIARGMRDWRDNSQNIRLAIGTHLKLYYYDINGFTDITPYRGILTGTLSNPVSTTNNSTTVSIAHTAHGLSTGDYVTLTAASSFNGVLVAGVYVITVTDANDYTIVVTSAATGTGSGGGGNVTYTYYRVTLTNPFTTTISSAVVTVTHANHGAVNNDFVFIAGASAVGGLTLAGEYQIGSVSANTYAITASSNATSSATGGGTPTVQYDINSGQQDTIVAFGYGTGGYGQGGYGQTGSTGVTLQARTWSLWNYGQQMMASPAGGGLYVWDPTIAGRAQPLYNAPATMLAMFITPERFIVALGITGTLMQLAWCDQNSSTTWVSLVTNTANSGRTIQGGSYLVGGIPVRDGVSMFWTNTKAFTLSYTGDFLVYRNETVGDGAGLIGPLAATELGGVAYWMGDADFWSWNGGTSPLPSDDIRDFVFTTKSGFPGYNSSQTAKFWARTVRNKKEVWFYYCSAASTEIDRYVIFHADQQCWSTGTITKTSGVDKGLYATPMSVDTTGLLYTDETGTDANGAAIDSFIVLSPTDMQAGEYDNDISGFLADFQRITGTVNFTALARRYPNDADSTDGPYAVTGAGSSARADTRLNGKMVGWKLESNAIGGDYRIGVVRVDLQAGGQRQ